MDWYDPKKRHRSSASIPWLGFLYVFLVMCAIVGFFALLNAVGLLN